MPTNSSIYCRTQQKVYLPYDQYRLDVCAICYKYMPSSAFNFKLQYVLYQLSLLFDERSNTSYEADPFNVSRELSETFVDDSRLLLWKSCCLSALECCHQMVQDPMPSADYSYCPRTWDGWQCWPDTPAGMTAKQPCQEYIYFESTPPSCTKYAYKECWPNGTWYSKENFREWTNYTKCGRRDDHRRYLNFHIATYIISIISLIPALIIFMAYKQLQVHRVTMHKNLFLSLLLNALAMVLFKGIIIENELQRPNGHRSILNENGSGCKILLILTKYFRMTNYMWMFCEGFYLHKLIAAAFAEQRNLIVFYIIGWGLPLVPVGIYAILRAVLENEKCWALPVEKFEWIMNVPNLLSLLINLYFLCHIIGVLVTKVRATHCKEPNQYRKAVRATLVLVPLFGLHFCLVIYRPQTGKCGLLQAYVYFNYAMDGLQGLMVAVIFCYLNNEVIYLVRRTYQRYKVHHQFLGASLNSTILRRLSATQDSTINESQHYHSSHKTRKANHRSRVIARHMKRHSHDGILSPNSRESNPGALKTKKTGSHEGILSTDRDFNAKELSNGYFPESGYSSKDVGLMRERSSTIGCIVRKPKSKTSQANTGTEEGSMVKKEKQTSNEAIVEHKSEDNVIEDKHNSNGEVIPVKSCSVEVLL
ncbi:calcitonin gene-related peptide type 1 receptor-like [Uloborus diversus]|uniref:calcitonin gene-related peptide type 1 receptor-like n=1 Tax=Uloborus diversus TaxID=327109 RepID=UPI002409433A|nr:calcitonin gene-related peptide type 1 receptor-like [Uloborus diversus]